MDFKTFMPLALRTAKSMPTAYDDFQHAALGLLTESGEFATEVKRITIYGKPTTPEIREHMIEELGDIQWYVPLMMRSLDIAELPPLNDEQIKSLGASLQYLRRATLALGGATMAPLAATMLHESFDEWDEDATLAMPSFLACIVWLCDKIATIYLGAEPNEVRAACIEKLQKRFPEAYSDAAAEARADKGGVDARNS